MALLSVDEAKDTLNDTTMSDQAEAELQDLIDALTVVIEAITGPVASTAYDEFYDGGQREIVLRHAPVLTVTSVTEWMPGARTLTAEPYGTDPYTAYGYRLDQASGVLHRVSGGLPFWFWRGTRNIQVVYTAGRSTVPPNIKEAARRLVRVHWQPQQAGNLPGIDADELDGTTVLGYFVPNAVNELLEPSQLGPVVA